MSGRKDTVMVEFTRADVAALAEDHTYYDNTRHGRMVRACRAALEAERVAEREAWAVERDRVIGDWVIATSGAAVVTLENVCVALVTGPSGDDGSCDRLRRATFIASAPDMARLLERLSEIDVTDDYSEALTIGAEARRLLRSNSFLPPEDE